MYIADSSLNPEKSPKDENVLLQLCYYMQIFNLTHAWKIWIGLFQINVTAS